MSNEIFEAHSEIYESCYDDHDKYFDLTYNLYEQIHDYAKNIATSVLDRDNTTDFFEFCFQHLNRAVIEKKIRLANANQLVANNKVIKKKIKKTKVKA
jgi:hypothetical protein